MMRFVLVFLLVGAATVSSASAASRRMSLQPPASSEELPLPPVPPDQDGGYLAAPVPNNGVSGPGSVDGRNGPELSPGFYQPKDYNIGQGYLPGSTVQGEQEHRAKPMPSLKLTVPLE